MLSIMVRRRSIRKYKQKEVSEQKIEKILQAGMLAPSSKNRQPWKFIVVMGKSKAEMLAVMEEGIRREKGNPLLPESAKYISGAEHTLEIMRQAPVVIMVMNTLGISMEQNVTAEERIYEICNAQSIGAAIENMTLEATKLGLGSLWICDTYFALQELNEWLQGELIAALAIGYADENPAARPRKEKKEIVEWRK